MPFSGFSHLNAGVVTVQEEVTTSKDSIEPMVQGEVEVNRALTLVADPAVEVNKDLDHYEPEESEIAVTQLEENLNARKKRATAEGVA